MQAQLYSRSVINHSVTSQVLELTYVVARLLAANKAICSDRERRQKQSPMRRSSLGSRKCSTRSGFSVISGGTSGPSVTVRPFACSSPRESCCKSLTSEFGRSRRSRPSPSVSSGLAFSSLEWFGRSLLARSLGGLIWLQNSALLDGIHRNFFLRRNRASLRECALGPPGRARAHNQYFSESGL